jgi:hypothetical protein
MPYMVSHKEKPVFCDVIMAVILSKNCTCTCPIQNGYSSKITDNEEILGTVSSTSIYCSSDKVGTDYLA